MLVNIDKVGVSLVIVTYNGRQRLQPTLLYLSRQQGINFDFEIVVVDNNSSDKTADKVKDLWKAFGSPFELRVVRERKAGTMFARKKGIETAQYRYLLYCDDDNWLQPEYVSRAYEIIRKDENIAAVGGKGIMQYEDGFARPKWMGRYERNFGTTAQGKIDGDTTYQKGCLYTAGAILDRHWINKLWLMGFESALKGRDEKTLVAGEDTELTYALKLIGGRLYYSSQLEFLHFMPKERINWDYLRKLWKSLGYSNYILTPYNYYFLKSNTPNPYKRLFVVFRSFIKLHCIIKWRNLGEGDHSVLEMEKLKGEMNAILFGKTQYKVVQQTITILKCQLNGE